MSTSLIIQTEDHITGSAQQMTVTDINPNATNADLLTFAQMTAGLSKDTYVKSARVDKVELDNPLPAPAFTPGNISSKAAVLENGVYHFNLTTGDFVNGTTLNFFVNGAAVGVLAQLPVLISDDAIINGINIYSNRCLVAINPTKGAVAQEFSATLFFPASPSYSELALKLKITIEEG